MIHIHKHILACVGGVNGEGGESKEETRSLSVPVPFPPSLLFCPVLLLLPWRPYRDFDDQSSPQVLSNI